MKCLVLGAAGFLGVNLVDRLVAEGHKPVCGRRKRTNVIPLRSRHLPLVNADLDEPGELVAAMAGKDVVFHLAAHYPRTSTRPLDDLFIGLKRTRNVFDAAAKAGVRRMVFVSSTATVSGAADRPSTEADTFDHAPGFGLYHDLKWHLEAMALAEQRMEVVVACPGACIGAWDLRVGTSALLVATAAGMRPPHPDGWVPFVDAADVATALTRLAGMRVPPRRVILSAYNLRLHSFLSMLSRRYHVAPPLPALEPRDALELADAAERDAVATHSRPRMTREIVDLVIHGVQMNATLARVELGWRPALLETTLDRFDQFARRMGFIPPLPIEAHA